MHETRKEQVLKIHELPAKVASRLSWERYKLQMWMRSNATMARNRLQGRSVVGEAPVAVSLTTHGSRLKTVHLVIEALCAGSVRPARLVLWLNGDRRTAALPAGLLRLERYGLEIRFVENYGPHTKYYPYVDSLAEHAVALVTADDDMLYPPHWLERLLAAHEAEPGLVHCYRARKVKLADGVIAPYLQWGFDTSGQPSFLNFGTGVSGVIYPPAMLMELKRAGEAFRACCPKADDIWLHAIAVRRGFRVKQLGTQETHFDSLPNTQGDALFHGNLLSTGNDVQIAATYRAEDIRRLMAEPG